MVESSTIDGAGSRINNGICTLKSLTPHDSVGDVIDRWVTELHTARVFVLPMQVLICITGLFVTMLPITGALFWLRKRKAQKKSTRKTRANKEVSIEFENS